MPRISDDTIELTLELLSPTDLPGSLRPFGRWGDDYLDRWDGTTLVRTLRIRSDDLASPYVARVAGNLARPALVVQIPRREGLPQHEVAAAIRRTFVHEPGELEELAASDEHIARLARLHPGIWPVLVPEPFTALVRSISAQQINLAWAATVRRRLAERYGTRHEIAGHFVYSLHPAPLAGASVDELRALQLTAAKARSVIACARAAVAGELAPTALEHLDDEGLITQLTRLPGIGRWSAEWFLARTLGRPRVVAGDLGVRKAVGRLYGRAALPSEEDVRELTAHWGRAATIAQALALFDLAGATGSS